MGPKLSIIRLQAKRDLRKIKKLELEKLPVCIAKTQKSLSDNPKLLGPAQRFCSYRSVKLKLPPVQVFWSLLLAISCACQAYHAEPAAERIDIDESGNISGLF